MSTPSKVRCDRVPGLTQRRCRGVLGGEGVLRWQSTWDGSGPATSLDRFSASLIIAGLRAEHDDDRRRHATPTRPGIRTG